ncbi:protein translocase subunit SecD [Crossiella cryophila]|uniref:Multifunctional fusion protein n=1 Tax=Crossiella cryophila TaxID=43355 RepID=A0A7W7FWS0_9PSEU|nr:protein translocase subunit SecD [Crossiella cryophila]MBB4680587.1 SecD/SecF fusion protein [Crossiella cryophila]
MRGLLSLAVLVTATYLVLSTAPRLGLDLRGGTQIVLEAKSTPTVTADANATDRALEVIRRRVDSLGVAEPGLVRSGENRIIVELPGVQDPKEAVAVLGRTAQLTMHPVLGVVPPGTPPAPGEKVLPDESGAPLRLAAAALTGENVAGANSGPVPQGVGWQVGIDFSGPGGESWRKLTGQAACSAPGDPKRRVAIVLDDKVISSPQVDPSVGCQAGMGGGNTRITGKFTQAEANELSLLISGGALPVPVEVLEQRTVGPTLGAQAIEASAWAALIGVGITGLFLTFVYRLVGFLAVLALAGYAALSYSSLLAIGATLTLPGLAGLVLAVGMAVDANVLVFERAREDFASRSGLPPRQRLSRAMEGGFKGAVSAIADSNVTTLLAAGLLFFLASGPVRGFGVTLSVGVLASLFSALVLTRVLMIAVCDNEFVAKRPWLTGLGSLGRVRTWLTGRFSGLYANPKRWLLATGAITLLIALGLVIRGPELGVEFTGGRLIEYTTQQQVNPDAARDALQAAGFDRATVSTSGEKELTIKTAPLDETQAAKAKEVVAGLGGGAEQVRSELIGPSLGDELRTKALLALAIAVAAQLAYLAIRFDWRLGVATVAALLTDVVVLLGLFSWLGITMDAVFLAALLTVIGYSVNDSVVVFDRVRELRGLRPKEHFHQVAGTAVLQTLPRTVNTGVGVLAVLLCLLFLGDGSLADFALAVLVGVVAGTISTVATASPLAVLLDRKSPGAGRQRAKPRQQTRRRVDSGAVV